jgi:hypothetical protein
MNTLNIDFRLLNIRRVLLLLLSFSLPSTSFSQKLNLDQHSSILNYFAKAQIRPLVVENSSTGFVSIAFNVTSDGYVRNIEKQFASDSILVPSIIKAIKNSSGKWVLPKKYLDQRILLNFYIQPFYADSIKQWAESSIQKGFEQTGAKSVFIPSNSTKQVMIVLPVIRLLYEIRKPKTITVQ